MIPVDQPISFRSAVAADIPSVQRLADLVWRRHYPGIISAEQIDYMLARGYASDALASFIGAPDAGIELAEAGRELVGFAAWLALPATREVKLDKLYVHPDRQGTGVGGALIGRVADHGRRVGASAMVLNVNKDNRSAQEAYRRHGFAIREAVVVDIGAGFVMDDYVMVQPL